MLQQKCYDTEKVAQEIINVMVVDDHALMRDGLRRILSEHPKIRVVGEAAEGRQAVELVRNLKPHVLVLDLMLPTVDGLDVLNQVGNETRVLAISMRNDEGFVAETLRRGAWGYVLKEASGQELVTAITAVHAGQRYVSKALPLAMLMPYKAPAKVGDGLTPREMTILRWCADGATSAQIGKKLSISPRTVEMHRKNVMRKLGFRCQTDLVRYAIRNRIVSP
jgi:DNA-binding NarL/FixJ family response regulator